MEREGGMKIGRVEGGREGWLEDGRNKREVEDERGRDGRERAVKKKGR